MKLYYYPGACSLADHIVLEWVGVQYEPIRMSRDSVKSPAYLAMNPAGAVPLLKHGELLLTENVAILVYLAELYPQAQLLGDGTLLGRAEVMRWLAYLNSDVHGAFKPIFSPMRFLADETLSERIADTARLNVSQHLARLDAQLEGRDWLTGDRSVADPYLFVMLRWAIAQRIGMRGLENLSRFVKRMGSDAGVLAATESEEGLAVA
jgi:glutathione S-transferase